MPELQLCLDFMDRSPQFEPEPPENGEDSLTALALKRSIMVLVLLGSLAGGSLWWFARPPTPATPSGLPKNIEGTTSETRYSVPSTPFHDVTKSSGVHFLHVSGATGAKYLPETMGSGVAFFDCDGDGDQDLLFANSQWWPGSEPANSTPPTPALYENDGHGHFRDITSGSGLDVPMYGTGIACADYDNDGLPDVLFTGVGGVRLFHNLGQHRFAEVTAEAGLSATKGEWSTAAAWFDMDNDGDLDLFIGNYVVWSANLDKEVNNQLVGIGKAYGRPWNFGGTLPHLFRNDGGGHFTDVSAKSGLQVRNPATGLPMAKTLAVIPIDLNDDGWIDLVVANDTIQNFAFTNRHDGTFAEVGQEMGVAFDAYGQTRGAMGIDAARFREDDRSLGIAIGNFANEMNAFYVAQPGREGEVRFADDAIGQGIGPASQHFLKFGLFFFDYDLDGRLDVLTANGHIEKDIEKVQPQVHYRQPSQLFWNAGGQKLFVNVTPASAGNDLFQPIVGRGSAYADIDGDGDLDIVLTQVDGPPLLLRNDQNLKHHWVRLKLVGTKSNHDAIGAWISLRVGGKSLLRHVMPTKSYLSQSELPVTIGLGNETHVDSLNIRWPRGTKQVVDSVVIDGTTVITEP